MTDCPINGTATVNHEYPGELRWVQTDPEIHVAQELIDTADELGLAFLKARYELGEPCPFEPRTIHARLRKTR